MAVVVATLVAKTVAAIASTTNSLAVYSYNSKAALESAELYNRTTMSVLAGAFFNFITRILGDNLNVGDSQTLSTSKQQSEEVQVSETVDIVANFNRLPTETVNLGEIVNLVTGFNRLPTDGVQLSNPGVVLNQGYINGPGYFSSDYVGTSRQIS
jgi:hypothetical protein